MGNIIILGAGAKVNQTCDIYNLWDDISQFYETPYSVGEKKRGIPVTDILLDIDGIPVVHCMVGDCRDKRRLVEAFTEDAKQNNLEFKWGYLSHKSAIFTHPKSIGEDVIIRPLSIICSKVVLEDHVDVGNLSNIEHDCVIGDYSVIAGGVSMSGNVTLGKGVFIGQGASIKPGIRIGDGAVIGLGAAVVKDVAPNMVVGGNPAKTNVKFKKVSHWSPQGLELPVT